MAKWSKSKKLFWGWAAVEVLVTGWIGWQVAAATETRWAREPKKPRLDGGR